MDNKDYLLLSEERKIITKKGYLIGLEVELWKLPQPQLVEFPHGFKFKLLAYNLENPSELVRIDNHHGKRPHYHLDKKEVFFTWVSLSELERLFLQLSQEKFGPFAWDLRIKEYE